MSFADEVRAARALHHQGRVAEALMAYLGLLQSEPEDAALLALVGAAELQMGRFGAGIGHLQASLKLRPQSPQALTNLGMGLYAVGRYAEALAALDQSIAGQPEQPGAHFNRGLTLQALARSEEALVAFRRAIALAPGFVAAMNNAGVVEQKLGRVDAAFNSFSEAITRAPDFAESYCNRGNLLKARGEPGKALADYNVAVKLAPKSAVIHNNRGNILKELCRYGDALAEHEMALKLQPDFADARWSKALLHLLRGDFATGWDLFESRWQGSHLRRFVRDFPQSQWGGEDLSGKTILLHAEQGLGDTVQFCRYVPMVSALGAEVYLEVQPELKRLIRTLPGKFHLLSRGDDLPDTDYHCPLMSLPRAFQTRAENIPGHVPYLFADQAAVAAWLGRLPQSKGPRIGLCWSGNAGHGTDLKRSVPLADLAPLLKLPGPEFHALQKEIRPEDQTKVATLPLTMHTEDFGDFADTAALMVHMDVVISVDTSVAHVAAALGKPVWLLLPRAGEWRWMLDRNDSPWYPRMQLFRQQKRGDWAGAVSAVCMRLRNL